MRIFLLTILFTMSSAFAGLDRLNVQNLNLDYTKPFGKGDVEKISVGFSTKSQNLGPYPVDVHRTENNLEINSPFLDLIWNKPWAFVHDMDQLSAKKLSLTMGKKDHAAFLESASFTPKDQGPFIVNNVAVKCNGKSIAVRVENRLLEDCREKLELTVDSLNVPIDFFMAKIVEQYPQEELSLDARPADSLKLISNKGEFSLVVYTRVVFYAGLRAWGNVSITEDSKTVIIKINQIKFGVMPITSIVMRELRKRIKSPDVTITGNEIRINLHYETKLRNDSWN